MLINPAFTKSNTYIVQGKSVDPPINETTYKEHIDKVFQVSDKGLTWYLIAIASNYNYSDNCSFTEIGSEQEWSCHSWGVYWGMHSGKSFYQVFCTKANRNLFTTGRDNYSIVRSFQHPTVILYALIYCTDHFTYCTIDCTYIRALTYSLLYLGYFPADCRASNTAKPL